LNRAIRDLAADAELRIRLGIAGQALVREQFSTQRMVDSIYNLYLRLVATRQLA